MGTSVFTSRFLQAVLSATLFSFSSLACAETGVTASTITLGMSAPFSGASGPYGVEMRESISAYFQQVNASGGVNGRELKLVALDDGYEVDRTVSNTKSLLNEHKVFSLLGYYGSSATAAVIPIFSAAKTPLVGTISGADDIRAPVNRYMFHVRASYADETEAIINQWATLGLKNFAVFYQNDGFGKSGLNGVNAALKKYNLTPTALGTVERNSGDVSAAVAAIAKARPQAVVMVSVYKASAEFIRQMKKTGQSPQFAVLSPVGSNLLSKELGDSSRGVGISQVMPSPTNDIVPLVKDYRRLMVQAKKEQAITYFGLEGYLSARVLVEAMKKAGKDLTREKVVEALEGMHQMDIGGYRIDYSPTNHNGSKFVDVIVIGKDGRVMK